MKKWQAIVKSNANEKKCIHYGFIIEQCFNVLGEIKNNLNTYIHLLKTFPHVKC